MRDNETHIGPCADCSESFHVFADIFKLYDKVKRRVDSLGLTEKNPTLIDDMNYWESDIEQFLRNFLDYRRHIAQAEDESIHDGIFYHGLKPNEAVVVMDFKMKILASMHREAQMDWFSKRGFSCLGAAIIFGSQEGSSENEVLYHLFLSDDTTQDGIYVNTVKE